MVSDVYILIIVWIDMISTVIRMVNRYPKWAKFCPVHCCKSAVTLLTLAFLHIYSCLNGAELTVKVKVLILLNPIIVSQLKDPRFAFM